MDKAELRWEVSIQLLGECPNCRAYPDWYGHHIPFDENNLPVDIIEEGYYENIQYECPYCHTTVCADVTN